jgi:hypothetical protein
LFVPTVTETGWDGAPLAIATSVLAPFSILDGTEKFAVEAALGTIDLVLLPKVLAKKTWAPLSRGDQDPEKDSHDNRVREDGVPVHQSGFPRSTALKGTYRSLATRRRRRPTLRLVVNNGATAA